MTDKYVMNKPAQIYTFQPNPGYLVYQASDSELALLRDEVAAIAQQGGHGYNTAYSELVGVIDREYHLKHCRDSVNDLVQPLAQQYIEAFHYQEKLRRLGLGQRDLELGALWVNYQQPGEYNPLHHHDGAFSFVIWLDIPYTLDQEQRTGPGQRPGYKPNGDFHFHFTDTLGAIRTHFMHIDSTWRNRICLFPAELHHIVYPYYSTQDLRITVSGNLHIKL